MARNLKLVDKEETERDEVIRDFIFCSAANGFLSQVCLADFSLFFFLFFDVNL